jgi:hypothetical protein
MATLKFNKNFNDIVEGKVLPEDWYECRLVKEPVVDVNSKARNAGLSMNSEPSEFESVDGAGKNLILDLRVQSEVPEYHGRPLRTWLPVPMPGDDSRFTPLGQSQEDSKMQRIMEVIEAFGGEIGDDEVHLEPGSSAMFYVEDVQHFADPQKRMNQISLNSTPRKVE